jgi:hypothetical protein
MICYSVLLAAVLVGLIVPLSTSIITRNTQTMFIDRLNDTAQFAALAEFALRTGHTQAFAMDLRQYHASHGIDVLLVNRDGVIVMSQGAGLGLTRDALRGYIAEALSGERRGVDNPVWTWRTGPLVVAEPVGHGGEIIGGVLTISPVVGLPNSDWRSLGGLGVLGLLVMIAGFAMGEPITRWILRPLHDLDTMVSALPEGLDRARPAGTTSGPPELR